MIFMYELFYSFAFYLTFSAAAITAVLVSISLFSSFIPRKATK